jgi:hypothetical protein
MRASITSGRRNTEARARLSEPSGSSDPAMNETPIAPSRSDRHRDADRED